MNKRLRSHKHTKHVSPESTSGPSGHLVATSERRAERNKRNPGNHCLEDLVDKPDVQKLNYWLCRFVTELWKKDGQPYPLKIIKYILATLQWKMLDTNLNAVKFLDSSQSAFRELRRTCDTVYRDLHTQGIGATIHHTPTFSTEDENKLWSTGVLGYSTPKSLQWAVFFYIGKRFCIRGGEQWRLGPSQFVRSENPNCYNYVEHGLKNRSGGLAQIQMEYKCLPRYAVRENEPRCLVFLLDIYLNKLPQMAFREDVLYCRPKTKTPVHE